MKWFYMQAGAMPLLIAALTALYLRPGKRSPPEEVDGSITTGTATMSITRTTRKQPLKIPNHHASNYRRKALGGA